MNTQSNGARFYFLVSVGILVAVSLMLFFSALTFAIRLSLSWVHFPLSVSCAILANYYVVRYSFKEHSRMAFVKSTSIILLLFVFSIAIAMYFYDISYDGQAYHQETIIQLRDGWNPFYGYLPDTIAHAIWANHYCKGAEIPQAVIYCFFDRIEAGKALNFLLMFASFFLCVSFLLTMKQLSKTKVFLLSGLLALNPVVINQLMTYYVDGLMGSLLLCVSMLACHLFIGVDRLKLLMFGIMVSVTLNVKFTAIGFVAIFVIALLIQMLYQKRFEDLGKVFAVVVICSAIGIGLVGFNPYVTNAIRHQHPFYPLAGNGKVNIMDGQLPVEFQELNRFEKFFLSLISSTAATRTLEVKIPFTFDAEEIRNSTDYGTRIGGFGFLFSGSILVIVLLSIVGFSLNRRDKEGTYLCIYLVFILLLSTFIVSEAWWARYVPHFWFLPLVILVFSEHINNKYVKYIGCIGYASLVVNISVILVFLLRYNFVATSRIQKQLKEFRDANHVISVDFGPFESNRVRFEESNIRYISEKIDESNNVIRVEYSEARVFIDGI